MGGDGAARLVPAASAQPASLLPRFRAARLAPRPRPRPPPPLKQGWWLRSAAFSSVKAFTERRMQCSAARKAWDGFRHRHQLVT